MGLSVYLNLNEETVYDGNITHNLGLMASKAGIYQAIWRPEELNYKYAYQLTIILYKGLIDMKRKPDYYTKFNAPNNWGIYKDFIIFVENYYQACLVYPYSRINIFK